MERLVVAVDEREREFLKRFVSYPWYPLPPWTPILLLGDILAFALLVTLMIRQRRMAEAARQAGEFDRQALHQRKAGLYLKIIKFSVAITVVPHLVWLIGISTLPPWLAHTPLPVFMGIMIFTPFLVWLTPLAAVVVELMKRSARDLTR